MVWKIPPKHHQAHAIALEEAVNEALAYVIKRLHRKADIEVLDAGPKGIAALLKLLEEVEGEEE